MKTTVDISATLLADAKREAARRRTTLRALIEQGLRLVVQDRGTTRDFRLADARVSGHGMSAEFDARGWDAIRAAAYEDRGG